MHARSSTKIRRSIQAREHFFLQTFRTKLSTCALAFVSVIFIYQIGLAQTYTNPVIAGDFPDPSVIRVGEDYYAMATTGGWSPFFSIAHSRDLVNWNIVGSVFAKMPAWAKGDFWAPEIAEDKGKFYVFYTARRDDGKGKKGTLCVAVAVAGKPVGPWTDKGPLVCQEMGSIDAFFLRDENGKPFLIWKEDGNDRQQPTWMYAQELDGSLTKLVGKPKKLFRNEGSGWENHVVEGANVVRRDGWFYMFYSGNACCGRTCNYALGVARSKTILGKWEKHPGNPILAANEEWQCPGHGTTVTTHDGSDFLLYHAYRKGSEAFNIGREALLDKVEWTPSGWPAINGGRGPSKQAVLPFAGSKQKISTIFVDEFDSFALSPVYQMPMSPVDAIEQKNGTLAIAEIDSDEAVIAARAVSGDYTATTLVKYADSGTDETTGLSAYSWIRNAVGIGVGSGKITVWRRENGKQLTVASVDVPKVDSVYLRMKVTDGELFQFAYSGDGKNWTNVGGQVAGSHVNGARVALIHSGKGRSARFDRLKIEQN